jgi:hypothetical protein
MLGWTAIRAACFYEETPGPLKIGNLIVALDESGAVRQMALDPEGDEWGRGDTLFYSGEVLLLSFCLMNARNIVQQVGRPYRPPRKRDKKPLPLREMRVLRLDGRYVERASSRGDGSATPKRLHRYRGHWKEHGLLFGKYQCRVWVPDGQRGATELGVVDKRYEVTPWPQAA